MTRNQENDQADILSVKEVRRYTHQINHSPLGQKGQETLKQASILVVGAGGKGASVLENLAAIGIGMLGICDNFYVQEHDLSSQHLYGNMDLGKQKAIISREKLRELNPMIEYKLHNVFVNAANVGTIIKPYQLIIDTTAKADIAQLLSETSLQRGKAYLSCVTTDSCVFIAALQVGDGASYKDMAPILQEHIQAESDADYACLVSRNTLAASLVSNTAVQLCTGLTTPLNKQLLQYNLSNHSSTLIPF